MASDSHQIESAYRICVNSAAVKRADGQDVPRKRRGGDPPDGPWTGDFRSQNCELILSHPVNSM